MNTITIIGRICTDLVLNFATGDKPVVSFNIAKDRDYSKDEKEERKRLGKRVTDFFRVVVWGYKAVNLCEHMYKGCQIAVTGELRTGDYEDKEHKKKSHTEILATGRIDYLHKPSRDLHTKDFNDIPERG